MYAQPPPEIALQDCIFYHVMDLPGQGRVGGEWDLRGRVDEYLGQVDFRGRSVLEVGPASGFLTAEMEQRGAAVLALEMPPEAGWDYVPYPAEMLAPIMHDRIDVMRRVRNSFWFTHATLGLRARLAHASAYDIPAGLGQFDIAVLACVLLHCHSPLRILEQCARRAETLIITETHDPSLDGLRACQLLPTAESENWHTWWRFSPDLFVEFLRVMGFRHFRQNLHTQQTAAGPQQLFTIVASRGQTVALARPVANPAPPAAPPAASPPAMQSHVSADAAATSIAAPVTAAAPPAAEPANGVSLDALRASLAQLQQQLAELGSLVSQAPTVSAPPPAAPEPASDDQRAQREMQQTALRSLPLLPNTIRLDEAGLHMAGYAGTEGRSAPRMAFFVNGMPMDDVEFPIHDPLVSQRFAAASGSGQVVRARMTRGLDQLRQTRFWRFDAAEGGAWSPTRWRQAVHLMNPGLERFPMPTPALLERCIGSADSTAFAMGGAMMFKNIENWLAERGWAWSGFPRVLDWGCGAGRLTRYLVGETSAQVAGLDADPEAIAWCRANLPGGVFEMAPPAPPTRFAAGSFDLVVGVAMMTRLTERQQSLWLAELQRLTRPGALLFLSVRGPTHLAYSDAPGALYQRLQAEGFIDLAGEAARETAGSPLPEPSILQSRRQIERRWGEWFELLAFEDGMAALHDFVVLRRG